VEPGLTGWIGVSFVVGLGVLRSWQRTAVGIVALGRRCDVRKGGEPERTMMHGCRRHGLRWSLSVEHNCQNKIGSATCRAVVLWCCGAGD
jgi:hypothetical protein